MPEEAIAVVEPETELDPRRLGAILDAVIDGITVQRADGRLVFANIAAARAAGFKSPARMLATPGDRILGRFELFDESGEPLSEDDLPGRIVLQGGLPVTRIVGFRDRETGEERWSEVTARLVRDPASGTAFAVNAFHDLTFQKQAEDVLRRREAEPRSVRGRAEAAASRATRLHRLAIDMANATTTADAVRRAVRRGIPGRGARAIDVLILAPDRRTLRLAGGSPGTLGLEPVLPVADPGLATTATIHERRAQWLASPDELAARFPAMVEPARRTGAVALAVLPMIVDGDPLGVVVAQFQEAQPFDEPQRSVLRAFADLLAQAIHRIRLTTAREELLAERDAERSRLATLLTERLADEARLADLVRAEHARAAELNAILGAIGDPIVVVAADGTIAVANRSAEQLLGGLERRTARDLLRGFEPGDLEVTRLVADSPQVVRERNDRRRWFEVSAYAVAPDRGAETILILRDVTEARQREAIRDSFVGVLSHELRTPLTTIYGGAKVLARNSRTLEDRARAEIFEDIHSEAERLHRLVEDVVALTRFGEGGLVIGTDPILVQRVLPAVVESEASRWPAGRIEVATLADLPPVAGDMTYVEQVLRNLLANAMKYGGPTGTTRVETAVEGDEVAIRVLDEGPGFGVDEAARLFDLYYRSPAVAKSVSGSGIGLFVCARLVEAMGGRIWAANRAGGGAEFGFTLRILGDGDEDANAADPAPAGWSVGQAEEDRHDDRGAGEPELEPAHRASGQRDDRPGQPERVRRVGHSTAPPARENPGSDHGSLTTVAPVAGMDR